MSPIAPLVGDRLTLRRRAAPASAPTSTLAAASLPARPDTLLILPGNSGEEVGLRLRGHACRDGYDLPSLAINNDGYGPSPLTIHRGAAEPLTLTPGERYIMGAEGNPRDQIKHHPLLAERYLGRGLLRGIPVFETYNRGGRGGHSIPTITAMDIDLHIEELYTFLRRGLQALSGEVARPTAQNDLAWLLHKWAHQQARVGEPKRVVVLGGGTGSCGNASHQLLPYLVRAILHDLGITHYELLGVVLGPRAFSGLTAYTSYNYLALLHSLDYLARHGQRRRYLNGVAIDTDAPPYDRLFLLDDPHLPSEGATVTERELDRFLDRAALSLHLLLHTGAYEVVASHTANPLEVATDSRLRWLHTVNGALAGADEEALCALVAHSLEANLIETLVARLTA